MRHVIAFTHFCICLKFLRHAFFACLKRTWTFQGEWSFTHLEGLQMYSNKGCFNGKVSKIFIKTIFLEMLMDGCSKMSNNIFSRTQMNAPWMDERKIMKKCLDFQMAFKICRETITIMCHKSLKKIKRRKTSK